MWGDGRGRGVRVPRSDVCLKMASGIDRGGPCPHWLVNPKTAPCGPTACHKALHARDYPQPPSSSQAHCDDYGK